jgi:filamentous hemagglutinin family protein
VPHSIFVKLEFLGAAFGMHHEFLRAKKVNAFFKIVCVAIFAAACQISFAQNNSRALPTGGNVVAGNATITQSNLQVNINQTSQRAVVNWDQFNVGKDASVNFNQPNSSAVTLNRVTGASGSVIDGAVRANGQVILVNPNGVTFGKGAQIDAAGVVASTLDISNKNFMEGKSTFSGNAQGAVINQGTITANTSDGYIALLAPEVRNEGYLLAKKGPNNTVAMASGEKITLDFRGDQLLSVKVDEATFKGLIDNKRVVEVQGGLIVVAAGTAGRLMASTINNTGVVSASSAVASGGMVHFVAANINQAGKVAANGKGAKSDGGTVTLVGGHITLAAGSQTVAKGTANGGTINVGTSGVTYSQNTDGLRSNIVAKDLAKTTTIQKDAVVDASSTVNGNGGQINVWSSIKTSVAGALKAMGGPMGGDGGFVETSSKTNLVIEPTASVNTSAPKGKAGQWLLDPIDLTIDPGVARVISAALAQNNVVIEVNANTNTCPGIGVCTQNGSGSLTIASGADILKQGNALTSLTLNSSGAFNLNANIVGENLNVVINSSVANLNVGTKIQARQVTIQAQKIYSNGIILGLGSDGLGGAISLLAQAIYISRRVGVSSSVPGKNDLELTSVTYGGEVMNSAQLPAFLSAQNKLNAISGEIDQIYLTNSANDAKYSSSQGHSGNVISINASRELVLHSGAEMMANGTYGLASGSSSGTAGSIYLNAPLLTTESGSLIQANGNNGPGGVIALNGSKIGLAGSVQANGTDGGSFAVSADTITLFQSALVQTNGSTGRGGGIQLSANNGSISLTGALESIGATRGGNVLITANHISLENNSSITATGHTGGGTVLVGGDWQGGNGVYQATTVTMEQGAVIDASALVNGDGGKVVLWSDIHNANSVTKVDGRIDAKAGLLGGNGGQVETSGKLLNIGDAISVSTKASKGHDGEWLLDPEHLWIITPDWVGFNYTITGTTTYTAQPANPYANAIEPGADITKTYGPTVDGVSYPGVATLKTSTIVSALNSGNVRVLATGLIQVFGWQNSGSAVHYINSTTSNKLTIEAGTTLYLSGQSVDNKLINLPNGTLELLAGTSITQASIAGGSINAGTLILGKCAACSTNPSVTLTNAFNQITNLQGSNVSSVSVNSSTAMSVNSSGLSTTGAISLTAVGNIAVNGNITTANQASVSLSATGNFITNGDASTTRRTISSGGGNISIIADSDANGSGTLDLDYLTVNPGSGALLIRGEVFNWATHLNAVMPILNGSGSFTMESSDASFGQGLSFTEWIQINNDGSKFSSFTLGKAGNAADISFTSNINAGVTTSTVNVNGPITLYAPNVNLTGGLTTSNAATGNITIVTTGSGLTGTGGMNLADGRTLSITQSGTSNYAGVIAGTGVSLTKAGAGRLNLTGANTYTGGSTVSAGTLGLYHNTAAGTGTIAFADGTTLMLGRTVTTIANDMVLNGTVTLDLDTSVDYLIVGGGGGGGGIIAGGGGGGGVVMGASSDLSGSVTVTVGGGGIGGIGWNYAGRYGANGQSSVLGSLTALGGGFGGGYYESSPQYSAVGSMGSGGGYGPGANPGLSAYASDSNVTTFGNAGGSSFSDHAGGGGGGAGAAGASASGSGAGNGGSGIASDISGASTYYGGGGGGGVRVGWGAAGVGGSGGGGSGTNATSFATSGTNGLGGGGGAAGYNDVISSARLGGSGGSGVVIVRYLGGSAATGGTVSSGSGSATGYTIHNFATTGNSTLTLNALAPVLSGTVSGTGSLRVDATGGTVALTGTNTYANTTISGGTLSVGNTAGTSTTGSLGAGTVTNNAALVLWRSNDLTFANNIGGTGTLTKAGAGVATLTGTNTYSGNTSISAGTLIIGDSGTLGSGNYAGNISIANTNGGTLQYASSASQTLSGILSGAGAVTVSGSGTLTLTGNNSYSGVTTVSSGTLRLAPSTAFDSSLNGGLVNNANIIFDGTNGNAVGGTFFINGASGPGTWTVTGSTTGRGLFSNRVVLVGNTTISGLVTVTGHGNFWLENDGINTTSPIFLNGTNTLLNLYARSSSTVMRIGALSGNGKVDAPGETTSFTLSLGHDNGSADFSGSLVNSGTTVLKLTKAGTGTQTLSGTNTYTGATTITGGTLSVGTLANGGSSSNIGASSNVAGNLVFDGGTLAYTGSAVSTDRLFTITNNGGTISTFGTGALNFTNSGAIAYTGTGTRTLTLTGSNTGDNTLRPVFANNTGLSSLTKTGAGTWVLSGTNSYTGVTTITGGVLSVGALANGGTNSNIGASTNVVSNLVINGATLKYTGAAASSDRLFTLGENGGTIDASGTGALTFTNAGSIGYAGTTTRSFNLIGSGAATLSQILSDNTGATSLTKSGTGTWTLSGTNTYTGVTTISGGILSISSDSNLGTVPGSVVANEINLNGGALQATANLVLNSNRGITLTANSGLASTSSNRFVYAGIITGGFDLSINGNSQTGTVALAGSNTHTGGTTVSSGTLGLYKNGSLGSSAITLAGSTTLLLGRSVTSISNAIALTGNATVAFDTNVEYLIVGGGGAGGSGSG